MHFLCNIGSQVPARRISSCPLIPAELSSCMTRPDRVNGAGVMALLINPGHSDLIFSHGCGCCQHLHLASACIGLVGLLALAMLVIRQISHCAHTLTHTHTHTHTHEHVHVHMCIPAAPSSRSPQRLARNASRSSSVEQSFPSYNLLAGTGTCGIGARGLGGKILPFYLLVHV